jgi:putative RNA 2'-phosphotransferase
MILIFCHYIPVNLDLAPLKPPEFLLHGRATPFVKSIKRQTLVPRRRKYVHLSPDRQTAIKVGWRHGKPIVLTIQAGKMYGWGFQYFCSTNGMWLAERVPAEHILLPEE